MINSLLKVNYIFDYINNIFTNEKTGYINLVCVKSEYRGHGVGTFMLRELEKIARRECVTVLMLTSNKKRCSIKYNRL